MYLRLNDSNEIEGFATFGTLDDGKEYTGDVPDDFETSFKPGWYKLTNGKIVINFDYQEPILASVGPTAQDLLNADVLKQVAANTVATAAIMKQLAAQVKEA